MKLLLSLHSFVTKRKRLKTFVWIILNHQFQYMSWYLSILLAVSNFVFTVSCTSSRANKGPGILVYWTYNWQYSCLAMFPKQLKPTSIEVFFDAESIAHNNISMRRYPLKIWRQKIKSVTRYFTWLCNNNIICFDNYRFRLGFLEFLLLWTGNFMVIVRVRVW